MSKTFQVTLVWKDDPENVISALIGCPLQPDFVGVPDEEIFFYVESEEELERLRFVDNGEEFVVLEVL